MFLDTFSLAILLPPAYFFLVASITPGPNNIMLAASGMNFGYLRSLPHLLGIALGFGLLVVLCAVGVGAIYEAYPAMRIILRFLGASYLLYLAYRIATAGGAEVTKGGKPLRWHEALTFQFVNPKGWAMALTSVTSFMPDLNSTVAEAAFMLIVAVCINFPCTSSWVLFGKVIAQVFTSPKTRKIVNFIMAGALVAIIPFLISW